MLRRVGARARIAVRQRGLVGRGADAAEPGSPPVRVENLPTGAIGVRISASSESIFLCGVCAPIWYCTPVAQFSHWRRRDLAACR